MKISRFRFSAPQSPTHTQTHIHTAPHTLTVYFTHTTLCLFEVSLSLVLLLYVGSIPLQRVFRVS